MFSIHLIQGSLKHSLRMNVYIGVLCLAIGACGYSESGSPEASAVRESEAKLGGHDVKEMAEMRGTRSDENMQEFLRSVEEKFGQLKSKHAKLADRIQQGDRSADAKVALDATLENLIRKGQAVQQQIQTLKTAKGQDWLALQAGINQALADMDQAYENALLHFAG